MTESTTVRTIELIHTATHGDVLRFLVTLNTSLGRKTDTAVAWKTRLNRSGIKIYWCKASAQVRRQRRDAGYSALSKVKGLRKEIEQQAKSIWENRDDRIKT